MAHPLPGKTLMKSKFAAALACAFAVCSSTHAQTTKPDALLQIDLNRAAVVERIVEGWKGEIPAAQLTSFRNKLNALRADHLLAANLSGSFDGVLEIVSRHETSLQTPRAISFDSDRSKAVGDPLQDLVYTPVTPCRLFDSRAGQTSALGQLGGVMTAQSRRTLNAGGQCGIPATGVASVFVSFHAYNNAPATLGIISFIKPGDGLTAMAATWTGAAWATGTFIAGTNASGAFDVFVGNPTPTMTADMVVDVTGYFVAANRSGDGLRVERAINAEFGTVLPNVTNGDALNNIGKVCAEGTLGNSCRSAPRVVTSSTIAGGRNNRITDSGGTIGGGGGNIVGDENEDPESAFGATVAGGAANYATRSASTIGGGGSNRASATYSTISGGYFNDASGASSTISGGHFNVASGAWSSVLGGNDGRATGIGSVAAGGGGNNAYGDYSFAAGYRANSRGNSDPFLNFHGAFIWSDAGSANPISGSGTYDGTRFHGSANNQFAVRSRGGVVFRVVATDNADLGAGCALPAGGAASWSCSSDRNLKESIQSISPQSVLSKVLALPVTSWQFIGTNRRHIGPMAQDFRSAFGLGADDKNITTSDVSGVALAAIQGLNQKLEAEKAKNKAKEAEISALKADLALIKKKLGL
jgi:hypothetical protein